MKKRILSLILALSMVLSVLPLGAFAADPNQDLVMQGGFPVGTSGSDWSYDDITKTLTLTSGTYDFSNTNPKTKTGKPTNQAVRCKIEIQSRAEITGGIFTGGSAGEVKNYGTISGGTFQNTCSVTNDGTIMGNGTFEGKVTSNGTIMGNGIFEGIVTNNSTISGGTFQNGCSVTNNNTISGGTFQNGCSVINNSNIIDGTFEGTVTNEADGKINGGTFAGSVTNNGNGMIYGGTFEKLVTNGGTIEKGTFNGEVSNNQGGNITNGTFEQEVKNNDGGEISGGTFKGTVLNGNGIITGGTFAAGLSRNDGSVTGGVFNGYIDVDVPRVGVYPITVHEASPGAKIEKVNDVSAVWDPYVVIDGDALPEVTITASTDIYSLNGKSLSTNPYSSSQDNSDKTTVKFTMPKEGVTIGCGGLVMENGYPVGSNGNGWSYDNNTQTLTLTSGTFDFSSTEPVQCAIQSSATITGGTFEKKVTNNAGGIISGGTFQDTCSVTNNGTIKNGTFKNVCSVTNEGANATIENGTFKNMCRVINNSTIENGTFKDMCSVENNTKGTISGGTFTYKVENNGIITGGVFNGNANLTGVTGGYNITVASNAKIEKVNGVSADWAPYVVTSNATTKEVTITADTDIFSLNGQPIAESSYGSDKTTVTFTMPDDDVVLNKAITSTDLVMENGWPKDSNGGKNPCKGDGWEYIPNDPTNGDMLLLTGSNQTGGLFDFSTIGDCSAVKCNVFVGKPTAITGGEFNGKVFNNSGILGGTFHGEVDNMGPGRIENGTFKNSVENNGMIENGTFEGTVENNTNGTISGGTFAGSVSNNGGTVNGGIFNGNTGLDEVTGLHSIT